jgi:hypothetical protein
MSRGKGNLIWMSGDRYGYWTLTGKSFVGEKKPIYVECICICGTVKFIMLREVVNNRSKSCGCKKADIQRKNMTKHGGTLYGKRHPVFTAWCSMKSRCYNKNHPEYKNYGGRGIYVSKKWKDSFAPFKEWAENNNWAKGLSLERKKNNKGYSPENCIWATTPIQNRNKRNNRLVEAFGEIRCLMDWVTDERCHVSYDSVIYRIEKLKWDSEKAISHPKMKTNGELA